MTNKSTKPKIYRVPKELDILPPRPVLFPWLPGGLNFKPCFGLGESSKSSSSSSRPGTPATQPLSPSSDYDEFEDAMPDMSRVHDIPKHHQKQPRKYNYSHSQQQSQQLDTLTDVIVEILRVIFFIIKTKQALLKQNGEEPRDIPHLAAAPSRQQQSVTKNTIDVV